MVFFAPLQRLILLILLPGGLWFGGGFQGAIAQTSRSPASERSLGVVKVKDNPHQWARIQERLTLLDIDYCVVEPAQLTGSQDDHKIGAVFIPNLGGFSPAELAGLEAWQERGGAIIASYGGEALAQTITPVQRLLGVNFGFPVNQQTVVQSVARPLESPWRSLGVSLQPQTPAHIAATWQTGFSPPAVVVTPQTVVLGWSWGLAAPTALDVMWLKSAIARHGRYGPPSFSQTPPNCHYPRPRPLISRFDGDRAPLLTSVAPIALPAQVPPDLKQLHGAIEGALNRFSSATLRSLAQGQSLADPFTPLLAEAKEDQGAIALPKPWQTWQQFQHQQQTFLQLLQQQNHPQARRVGQQLWRQLQGHQTPQESAYPEIRAVWLDRGTLVKTQNAANLDRLLKNLAAAGINTVFLETVNASYPIYPSTVAPEQNPLLRGWDPLASAIASGHKYGLEIHSWVWLFAAANQRHNRLLGQPDSYLGPVLGRHPDWGITDRHGNFFDPTSQKAFFDPAHPEVQAYVLALMEEIVTRYDVDGIQFDYVRYPFQEPWRDRHYRYSPPARQEFLARTGSDPNHLQPGDPHWRSWVDFRMEKVSAFVAEASSRLRHQDPDLILSAAVFALEDWERHYSIQQPWEQWITQGQLDLLVPMTYGATMEEFMTLTHNLLPHSAEGSTLLVPAVKLTQKPLGEIFAQIQHLRDLPTHGHALFATAQLRDPLTQKLGSVAIATDPLPHREPFRAAQQSYGQLLNEWRLLLQLQNLTLDGEQLVILQQEHQHFTTALETLIQSPSAAQSDRTQLAFRRLERELEKTFVPLEKSYPYLVQMWRYRLVSINQYFAYGDRRLFSPKEITHKDSAARQNRLNKTTHRHNQEPPSLRQGYPSKNLTGDFEILTCFNNHQDTALKPDDPLFQISRIRDN